MMIHINKKCVYMYFANLRFLPIPDYSIYDSSLNSLAQSR